MSLRYLTPGDLAHMTPAIQAKRTANWKGIIRGLAIEHERIYHGPAQALAFLGAISPVGGCCGEPGCVKPVKARGWCSTHYQQIRRQERRTEAAA